MSTSRPLIDHFLFTCLPFEKWLNLHHAGRGGGRGGGAPPLKWEIERYDDFLLAKSYRTSSSHLYIKKSSRVKSSLLVTKLYHSILADCLRYPQRQMESSFDTHMSPQVFMGCLEIPYVSRDPHLDPEFCTVKPVFMNIGWTWDQQFCDKRRSSPFWRLWQDSNLQSFDPKSNALSIKLQSLYNMFPMFLVFIWCTILLLTNFPPPFQNILGIIHINWNFCHFSEAMASLSFTTMKLSL